VNSIDETVRNDLYDFFSRHKISVDHGVVAAFSGGADSLALLLLLSTIVPKEKLLAVYVNHRLRPAMELETEEGLNIDNCRVLGIPLRIVRLEQQQVMQLALSRGNGVEEAARILRYEALERVRTDVSFSYIATAHTADDQAETVLMRLLQGAGPSSMRGISVVSGPLVRPMLSMTRSDVMEIVKNSSLQWSEDSTNGDLHFLRNSIRHEIVPAVAHVFPQYRRALEMIAQRSVEYVEALAPQVVQAINRVLRTHDDAVGLHIRMLREIPRAIQEQVLYHSWSLVTRASGQRLPYRNVRTILDRLGQHWPDGLRLDISGTYLVRSGDNLMWYSRQRALAAGYVSLVYSDCTPLDGSKVLVTDEEAHSVVPKELRARINPSTLALPIVARSARQGDSIRLAEGTKQVGTLLAGWHIPKEDRWRIPVLEDALGIFAVLGGAYGGRDRIAKRCLAPTLARNVGTLYSIVDIEG
jgi:tRNA(Ile)-lysidine synthase